MYYAITFLIKISNEITVNVFVKFDNLLNKARRSVNKPLKVNYRRFVYRHPLKRVFERNDRYSF